MQGSSTSLPPINYFVVWMRLRWVSTTEMLVYFVILSLINLGYCLSLNLKKGRSCLWLHFLFLKPRRSLYKLRLKFVQTTAEVSRKYYALTNLSAHTHENKCVYLPKCLRVLTNVFMRKYFSSSTLLTPSRMLCCF